MWNNLALVEAERFCHIVGHEYTCRYARVEGDDIIKGRDLVLR